MRSLTNAPSLCMLLALILLAAPASGVTHRVDHAGGGDFLTIQEGMAAASPGDTVLVAPGTYAGEMNRTLDFAGKGILVTSEGGPDVTVIDCESAGRAVVFQTGETATAQFVGFTVENGTEAYGGAVRCVASSPTISDCVFRSNDANLSGGAMLIVANSAPNVTGCVFSGNSAHDLSGSGGGAIYCEQFSSPTFTACTFEHNTADLNGGAICTFFASPIFEHCMFEGNSSVNLGGAVMAGGNATPSFVNCTFVDNSSAYGGVMYASQSPGAVLNCVMALNVGGGTVSCADSAPEITHCIVYANVGGDSLCGDYHDNLFDDPMFCNAPTSDYELRDDSPCLPSYNPWGEMVGSTGPGDCGTGVGSHFDETELGLVLHPPTPNPFRGSTVIKCAMPPNGGELTVNIYSASGRRVRTLVETGTGTSRELAWDGLDERGENVASGVYFIRASSGTLEARGKVLVVK